MAKLFANSGDPDQMPCSAVSDWGLHCLSITVLGVSRLQWVNQNGFLTRAGHHQKKCIAILSRYQVYDTILYHDTLTLLVFLYLSQHI